MRDDLQAERERRAAAYYWQVRLYADKHGKKPAMAYMATKEKYPSVFIPSDWQKSSTPTGVDLDPEIEGELIEQAKAFAKANSASRGNH